MTMPMLPRIWLILVMVSIAQLLGGCSGGGGNPVDPVPLKPVLAITDITWTPAAPKVGEAVFFSAVVKNTGQASTPAGAVIGVTFSVDGRDVSWMDTYAAGLAPGQSVTLIANAGPAGSAAWLATAGTHQVRALVDKQQHIQPLTTPHNALAALCTPTPPDPPPMPVKLLPLGDSITAGMGSTTSYRYYLYNQLRDAGYTTINFIGSLDGLANDTPPIDLDWDMDHDGHVGWETGDFLQRWTLIDTPDIVLIQLGTNDLGNGGRPEDAIANLTQLIAELRRANPAVCIGLAQITPARSDYDAIPNLNAEVREYLITLNATTAEYNQRIVACADAISTAQSPVVAVDLYTILTPATDTPDGLHPNNAGCRKIAAAWYPLVRQWLDRKPKDDHPTCLRGWGDR